MESGEILKIVEDAFRHICFIIGVVVSNDDSPMRAVIKNLSIGDRGQVLKPSKGKLNEEIPVPYFLVYPSHHVKVFSKNIFSIVNYGKYHKCGCTKSVSIRLNKDWGI